jgi:hypothetical protein
LPYYAVCICQNNKRLHLIGRNAAICFCCLQPTGVFLEWKPVYGKADRAEAKSETDWTMVSAETGSVSYKPERQHSDGGKYTASF